MILARVFAGVFVSGSDSNAVGAHSSFGVSASAAASPSVSASASASASSAAGTTPASDHDQPLRASINQDQAAAAVSPAAALGLEATSAGVASPLVGANGPADAALAAPNAAGAEPARAPIAVADQSNEVQTAFASLERQVGDLTAQVTCLTAQVGGLTTQVSSLGTELTVSNRRIDGLAAKVGGLEQEASDRTTQIHFLTMELARSDSIIRAVQSAVGNNSDVPSAWQETQTAFLPRFHAIQDQSSLDTVRRVWGYLSENPPALRWAAARGQLQHSPTVSSDASASLSASSNATALSSASGIELARQLVGRIFNCHGVADLPAWFHEHSQDSAFLESTAADFASICADCKYAAHPSAGTFVISRQALTRIVDTYAEGPRHHPALVASCRLMLQILENFFEERMSV